MAHILAVFSLSLLLFSLLALPTSALPRSSPSFVIPSYTVNSTADPGDGTCDATECTLREAISAATGTDTIAFDIPDSDLHYGYHTAGVWTIILALASPLSGPSGDIVDGTTQATNYGSDTNPYGPEIEISGETLGLGFCCWQFVTSGNIIKGLVINRCPAYGIFISDGDNNTIIGNYIGTDATGTTDQGVGGDGILLGNGAQYNTIGGPGGGNIISANGWSGIRLFGATTTGNVIEGNYIGTDRTGTTSLGNGDDGIEIHADAHNNTVGPDNIIAYNAMYGVLVDGNNSTGNTITQNSIHSNGGEGISLTNKANGNISAPVVFGAICTVGGGYSGPNLTIEAFSDLNGEGRFYESTTDSGLLGTFTFSPAGDIFRHPYVTLTATDPISGTSEFSAPPYPNGCQYIYLPLILKNY
jgi:CSLREA domain-containing protein